MLFMLRKLFISVVLILTNQSMFSIGYKFPIPLSYSERLPEVASFNEMPTFEMDTISEDISQHKSARFAKTFFPNLNPANSGEWVNSSNGMVWRLGIISSGAFSIYLTCKLFFLNKNVSVYAYSPGYYNIQGPFTLIHNNRDQILSIPPVKGDSIIVEINISPEGGCYGSFNISKVHHDYTNAIFANSALKASSGCNEDINCSNGGYWQTEKRAVCKIISNGQLSTGTLVGNTSGSNVPYVLTANHTIFDNTNAAEAIFYFNYESESCGSPTIKMDQYILGGTLAATSQNLDFSLIRLNEIPPQSFRPYYVGWDARKLPPPKGTCIHQMWGNIKQIAMEFHPLQTASFNNNYDSDAFWKVAHWEIGTTDHGSSGAPLFNEKNRLTGTLTGGQARCGRPYNDYFSKFCLAWDKYPEQQQQLNHWLDGENKGFEFIDGYDPYGFSSQNCDTVWNGIGNYISKQEHYVSTNSWASNLKGISKYAEKFYTPGSLHIPSVVFEIGEIDYSHPLSYITLNIWGGINEPESIIYQSTVFINKLKANSINTIYLDSVIKVSDHFFIGFDVENLSSGDFVEFKYNTFSKNYISSMFVYNQMWQNAGSSLSNSSVSMSLGIVGCYGTIRRLSFQEIQAYPNPCKNYLVLSLPFENQIIRIECYDLTGNKYHVVIEYYEDYCRVSFDLTSGFYILKIETEEGVYYSKFLVSR
jgi:lysyl endopeptidase